MTRRLVFLALVVSVLQVVACLADSPGIVVGTTWQPMQSLGSVGKMLSTNPDGSKYFTWMNALGNPTPRHVYFNYIDVSGNWFSDGTGQQVNADLGAGYAQIDGIYNNRAAIAFHSASTGNPITYSTLAVDETPSGFGLFGYYDPPDLVSGNRHTIWPKMAVDRSNHIHFLMTENVPAGNPMRMCYTRSIDGGATWVNPVQLVDSVMVVSGIIKASHVSDKVVIAYSKPIDTSFQTKNDIVYILSNDGLTWNFQNRVNVTNYGSDDDSLWAYADLDVIFDYDDNIHIVWNAVNSEPSEYLDRTSLFHFTNRTNQIDQVRTPWPDYNWPASGCDVGMWNRPICKMNLGVYRGGMYNYIYAIWTQFDTSDCSAGGHANGDIYMSFSSETMEWQPPVNLTNSRTPGCACGECDNDNYASLDDEIRDSLNIFYSNDKNNGCIFDSNHVATESNMLYLAVPNPFPAIGIDEQSAMPSNFQLAQNYPNPFNSKTAISFELKEAGKVRLEIFDITGARIATLANKEMAAGHHQVNWDAGKYASGTYFYKLSAGEKTVTKQMVLIK